MMASMWSLSSLSLIQNIIDIKYVDVPWFFLCFSDMSSGLATGEKSSQHDPNKYSTQVQF